MNELLARLAETGPGLAIRATVLFAVAAGASLALAKASAARRHLVWAAALAASLVLPVLHVCAPEWAVLPAFTADGGFASSPLPRGEAGRRPGEGAAEAARTPRIGTPLPVTVGEALSAHAVPKSVVERPAALAFVSFGQMLAVLWLAGVLLGGVRLALAVGRIREFARRADPATGRPAALLAEFAHDTGIRRPVRCLVSRQPIVPMTWGWIRPVVLLPADAASWSAARLRVVLLHELAHVSRGDAATQLMAELARSVYWFHPLSWWCVRRLRVEQEAACDDRVLAAGAAAEDYAEELVAVTARLPHGLQAAGLAVAMGRRHTIEGRVRGILADDRDRRPVQTVRAALIGGVFAMLATVAAVVGPAADAEDDPAESDTRPTAAELPADTNTIESLSAEQARRVVDRAKTLAPLTPEQEQALVIEYVGLRTASWIEDRGKIGLNVPLSLNGLTSLDSETASALAEYRRGPLFLNRLATLDADTAEALAQLETLPEHARGWLLFDGVSTLSEAAAQALGWYQGDFLSLNGLTALSGAAATGLGRFSGDLHLNGLATLDADAAAALANRKDAIENRMLSLNGLPTLSAAAAAALAKCQDDLFLDGVTALDAKAAKALAEFKGNILSLNGFRTLDADTAKALAGYEGDELYLDGLTALHADTAKALAMSEKWGGYLPNITTFDFPDSVAIAKALATRKGPLSLPNLKKISPKTLSALIEKEDIDIPLIETLELIPEPDGSPTEDFVIPERLQKP